jgi:hypothetical protein
MPRLIALLGIILIASAASGTLIHVSLDQPTVEYPTESRVSQYLASMPPAFT